MDDNKKVSFTYETLFDLVRREKIKEDLQKMEPSQFKEIEQYVREKIASLAGANSADSIFAEEEKIKLQKQVDNIKILLRELYERREKKIVNMALFKSRTQSSVVDVTPLLEEEKPLFNALCTALSSNRDMQLNYLLKPQNSSLQSQQQKTISNPTINATINSSLNPPSQQTIQQAAMITINFISNVSKFVGRDLEVYGPYNQGETVTLPKELGLVLVAKGKAKEISENQLPNA